MHIQVLKVDWLWFTKNIHKYLQKGICMYMQVAISWQNWEKFFKIKHIEKNTNTTNAWKHKRKCKANSKIARN